MTATAQPERSARRPNIILILADDMGFSDIGCFGGEIRTPHLDRLGAEGTRMTSFYNTARCSPSRASLLTGLHPHQTGIGILTGSTLPAGYPGDLDPRCATIAEMLGDAGYRTSCVGKWHLAENVREPGPAWPTRRGFERHHGPLGGATSYFDPVTMVEDEESIETFDPDFSLTEHLGERADAEVRAAAEDPRPFFLYLAFTAPHWPLHARPEQIAACRGMYDDGWDVARGRRLERMGELGVLEAATELTERDEDVPAWEVAAHHAWQARRMEVYAAQVGAMDAAIGRVLDALEATQQSEDTIVVFLSDNGGCAEEIPPRWADEMDPVPYNVPVRTAAGERVRAGNDPSVVPGPPATFASYGRAWANVSNTPFREYKHWVHEGGIATPLLARWPRGGVAAGWDRTPAQLTDIVPTLLEAAGIGAVDRTSHPESPPLEGSSLLAGWKGEESTEEPHPLFFEHEGNAAVRWGRWKAVRAFGSDWELYDLHVDRTERHDLSTEFPERVESLVGAWRGWADRCGVRDRSGILDQQHRGRGHGAGRGPGSGRGGGRGLIQDVRSAWTVRETQV